MSGMDIRYDWMESIESMIWVLHKIELNGDLHLFIATKRLLYLLLMEGVIGE